MTAAPPAADVVARARDILAGRLRPEPLTLSPERQAAFDRLIHEHVTPTPEAYRFHHEHAVFDEHFDGATVLYTRLADGQIAVLGSGADDYRLLRAGLSDDEWGRVQMDYSNPRGGWSHPAPGGVD